MTIMPRQPKIGSSLMDCLRSGWIRLNWPVVVSNCSSDMSLPYHTIWGHCQPHDEQCPTFKEAYFAYNRYHVFNLIQVFLLR